MTARLDDLAAVREALDHLDYPGGFIPAREKGAALAALARLESEHARLVNVAEAAERLNETLHLNVLIKAHSEERLTKFGQELGALSAALAALNPAPKEKETP